MFKVKSVPINLNKLNDLNENILSKSPSLDSFISLNDETIKIHFEGDGPLGIRFKNVDCKMIVSAIGENTVASEYYQLKEGFIVEKINGYESKDYSFDEMMMILGKFWNNDSEVNLVFSKDIVYKFFKGLGCEEYYEEFIELGVKDLSDLNYLEYNDLIKMKIPYEERKLISLTLGLKCNLKIPRNESEIFEYESPKKIIKEKENIDLLRETMFHKKI
jgi:hypothetical protein